MEFCANLMNSADFYGILRISHDFSGFLVIFRNSEEISGFLKTSCQMFRTPDGP